MTRYLIVFLLLLISFSAESQNFPMDGTDITSCVGFFTDSGGNDAGYGPNENITTTICPDLTGGTHVQLVFPSVELGSGDELCFFDGEDATATQLSCATDFPAGGSFIIQATAVNPSGCITLVFTSDGVDEAAGWSADMNCIAACQIITSNLVGSIPFVMPADTGYIDICPGDGIEFFGAGTYPQDGAVYSHSDETSDFFWDFGDGTIGQGPNVFKVYDEPGGYTVQLTIVDQLGCLNTNFISQRVRVSTYPSYGISDMIPAVICSSDTITLAASAFDTTASLSVGPNTGSFQVGGVLSDSLALPDGDGVSYSTSIRFTEFSPGQILTDIDDFLGVCMLMEHSYMYDLDLELTCPDGTTVVMQDQSLGTNGEVFLGIPNESDDNMPNNPPLQGIGAEYCFRPDATNGTWTAFDNANNLQTLPAGDYNSLNSFDAFLGCPLNGEWTITITDELAVDNGWIFEWSIGFAQELYPALERFSPMITDLAWQDQNSIIFYEQDSIIATPVAAGVAGFTLDVMDDFGCMYDTTILIDVLPATHPDCYNCEETATFMEDTVACVGSSVTISAIPPDTIAPESVSYFAFSNELVEFSIYPPALPLAVPTTVDFVFPELITDGEAQIISVCVNLEHQATKDVILQLQSPAGTIINLSVENGSFADDYLQTCFTASATTPIAAGSPPFTGDFIPEESFNAFNGENLTGDWSLLVSDASDGFKGVLQDWTITFAIENGLRYNWAPNPDFSCIDCAEPEIMPTVLPATYTVEITDDFGCTLLDTITLTEVFGFPAVDVVCSPVSNSAINFSWNDIGAMEYEVSLDGGMTWITPTGNFNHLYDGLTIGQMATLQVRAVAESDCPSAVGENTCTTFPCMLTIDTISTQRPACQGDLNGGAVMTAANGSNPIEYFVNGAGPFTDQIMGLGAGPQEIIGIDADGCRDTVTFTLASISTPIMLTTDMDSVDCAGETSGIASVMATGGFGSFEYTWNTVPVNNTNTAGGLAAGTYMVTVEDQAGCTAEATVIVLEPTPLTVTLDTTAITCNGANDGTATLTPAGGTAPYTYSWTGGITDNMISSLGTATFSGTVTDSKGCSVSITAALTEPVPVTVNLQPENLTCFENASGMITATPADAVGMVTYSWTGPDGYTSTVAQPVGLIAGEYCVTITDENNCIANACTTLTEPAAMMLSIDATQVDCFNAPTGTATVTASGGAGNYQYNWSDPNNQNTAMATGLLPGDYTVTVTDMNNCFQTISINVPNGTEITLAFTSVSPRCSNTSDGSATAIAGGGAGSFTYQWDTAAGDQTTAVATNLVSGNYCVTATDMMGCTIVDCVEVMPTSTLELPSISATDVSCFGLSDGTTTVTVSGGTAPYTYSWDDDNAQNSSTATGLPARIYNVVVTDSNTCTETAMIEVIEPDTLTIAITPTAVACFGENNGSIVSSVMGGNGDNIYNWSNGTNLPDAVDLTAGNYEITVTDAMGCMATAATLVTEPAAIMLSTASTPADCFNASTGTATVTASGGAGEFQYIWNDVANQNTAVATDLLAGDYTVTVTDANNCSRTIDVNVGNGVEITLSFTSTPPLCANTSDGTATATASGGAGSFTYQWDAAAGDQTTEMAINLVSGNYCLTVTDMMGCTLEDCVEVNSTSTLEIPSITATAASCFGVNDGTVTVDVTGGTEPYSYLWDDENAQFSNPAVSLPAGIYNVVVTDANTCTETATIEVIEPDTLIAEITPNAIACFGENTGSIASAVTGGNGGNMYTWTNGTNLPDAADLIAGNYGLTVTDAMGCSATASTLVTEPVAPIMVTIAQGDTSCFGAATGSAFVTVQGGTPAGGSYNYSWTNGGGTDSVAVNMGAGIYRVSITDDNGCTEEATIDIQEYSEIEINIASVDPACFGEEDGRMAVNVVSRDGTVDDLNDYTYDWSNGASGMAIIDLPGNTNYLVTVTDIRGCEGDTSRFLQAPDRITLNVLPTEPSCFGETNGSVEILNVNGNTADHTFEWSTGATTEKIETLSAGNYRVTVTDDLGCTVDSLFVLSEPQELWARLTVSPNGCEGQAIGGILAEPMGGTPPYDFRWSNGETTAEIGGLASEDYSLILTDAQGCQHFDTIFVGRPDQMMVSFEVENPSCAGDRDGRITATVTGGIGPFSFSVDDETYFGTNVLVGLRAGTYDVHIRDQTNCTLVETVTVTDPPAFTVLAGDDVELQLGDSIQLIPDFENNIGNVQLSWSGLSGGTLFCETDTLSCIDPWVQTFFTNTYELYGVDENGCEDTDEIEVVINKSTQVFVPTAFTPNGDNANDLLIVHGVEGARVESFVVFDRWGTRLFSAGGYDINSPNIGWNGTYRGKLSPTGIYTWKAEVKFLDGTEKLASGHTTLLR